MKTYTCLRSEYSTCLLSIMAYLEYDLTQVEVMRKGCLHGSVLFSLLSCSGKYMNIDVHVNVVSYSGLSH